MGKKTEGFMFIKQGQRRDVRAQRRDVPESLLANIATFGLNIATFQKCEIAMSERGDSTSRLARESTNPTSRHSREWCQLKSRL